MSEQVKQTPDDKPLSSSPEPKVTGIGGIFFFAENPAEAADWYARNLGLEIEHGGVNFESRNAARPAEVDTLRWNLFPAGSAYFAPSTREFMINYRVQNLAGLADKLRANGVTLLDEIQSHDYGKFLHILGPDGSKIELWEPVEG